MKTVPNRRLSVIQVLLGRRPGHELSALREGRRNYAQEGGKTWKERDEQQVKKHRRDKLCEPSLRSRSLTQQGPDEVKSTRKGQPLLKKKTGNGEGH